MKKFAFIVNPVSGAKDKTRIVAEAEALFPGCDILYTAHAGHARELAANADADVVVAVGGDGTVNEVASGLVGTEKALGIIPCGSGDGLALHLGISRNYHKALEQLKNGVVRRMDCGRMNGRCFFCTSGVGFDAKVGLEFSKSKSRGLWTYVSMSARNWFSYKPDHYKVIVDGAPAWEGEAVFITVGNASQWGNNARICGGASVLDGLFNITIVKPFSTMKFPPLLVRLASGKITGSSSTLCLQGRNVVIERSQAGPAHFDGEPLQEGTRLEFELLPSSLNVLTIENNKI